MRLKSIKIKAKTLRALKALKLKMRLHSIDDAVVELLVYYEGYKL